MKSLFNKYEAYNTYGNKVSNEMQKALEPIFEKWSDKGYKINDIQTIANDNIFSVGAIIRIKRRVERSTEKDQ